MKHSKNNTMSRAAGGRRGCWRPSLWAVTGWSAMSLSGMAADLYLTNTASLIVKKTAWSSPISVPKFNPALGTLLDVELRLSGIVQSTPRVENLDPVPRTVTAGSSSVVGVYNSTYNALYASVNPVVTLVRNVTAYDGATDFGGPLGGPGSGFSSPPIAASLSSSTLYPTGHPLLASFVGTGTLAYGMRATGSSIATGAVNLLFAIDTQAGGTLSVVYHYRPPEASVGDRVWVDLNQNGAQDAGEPGLPGVTVMLYNSSGNPVAGVVPQTTGPSGEYLFTGILVPGGSDLFTVQVSQPAGYNQTFDLDDGVTATPSSANSATFALAGNDDKRDVDFGYVQPLGSLGDRVWHDVDGNGVQSASEVGLQNATVTLYAAGGSTPLDTRSTDSDGKYLFTGLPAGGYTVVVSGVPATFRQTFDLDDGVKTGLTFLTPHQASATIGVGESRLDVDFGYQQIDASVGDYVWLDRNRNGLADGGESPIAGVAVALRDGNGVVLATSTTDGNGAYLFSNLAAGNYSVLVTPPAGYEQTFDLDDGVTPAGGFASASAASFALGVGQAKRDVDFGYVGGQLGDRVWHDVNGDGVQDAGESGLGGVVVTLTADGGTFTTTTDGNGFYTFGNLDLPAGTYTVAVTPPPGYRQTYDLDDGAKTGGFVSADTATATLGAGVVRQDLDFGYQQLASLGDRVWLDYNGDGVQSAGEVGIEGRAVALFQVVGGVPTQVATQTTDNNGFYHFNDLAPGDYRVTVLNPPARHITTWDFDDQTGGVLSLHTAAVTLVANQHRDDVDFGYQPLGSLGDTVWLDLNKNGVQDGAAEVGISGATVTVTSPTAGTFTVTTGANGTYLVDNLPAAVYTVAVTLPAGLLVDPSYDLDDGLGLAGFATPNQASATLAPGQDRQDFDFGYAPRAAVMNSALGDLVWVDSNADGIKDAGESPMGGVLVKLMQDGVQLTAQVTSPTGYYLFSGLEAGIYTVEVDATTLPAGYQQTYDLDDGAVTGFLSPNITGVEVAENVTRLDVDFGYYQPLMVNAIGDYVWLDSNRNGIQDLSENVSYPFVTVQLLEGATGTMVVDTQVTGANGAYLFDNTPSGTYRIRFVPPPNYSFTAKDANGNGSDAADSDADLITGVTAPFTVSGGQELLTIDAGLVNQLLNVCMADALYPSLASGTPLCDKVRSPGYWRNWKNHYTTVQFQAIIAKTVSYQTRTVAQVEAVLKNNADQYSRHLMAAQLTAAISTSLAGGIYQGAGYAGQTFLWIVTTAAKTPAASAPLNLRNAVLYLGAGGESDTGTACQILTSGSTAILGQAISLPGIGADFVLDAASGKFIEKADGTATLTGTVRSKADPTRGFTLSVIASGYSDLVPASPAGSPKLELPSNKYIGYGGTVDPSTWTYYTSFTGTLTGVGSYQGAVLNIARSGPSLQVGFGANGKNVNWGMSSGFTWSLVTQPTVAPALPAVGQGNLNVDLVNCNPTNGGGGGGGTGSALCGLIRSPGYWKNWPNHYTAAQLQAIIAATPHYKTLTIAQVEAVLNNTGDQFRRHLMAAELNAAAYPAYLAASYTPGTLAGATVAQILAAASATSSATAPADLYNAILYLAGGGETDTSANCLLRSPVQ